MHLYLGENPRTIYLVTSSREETDGRPRRALVFRAAQENTGQAIVEFLPKDQVNLANSVRLTSRVVKGCLGLINVMDGASRGYLLCSRVASEQQTPHRCLPCRHHFCYGGRKHQTDGGFPRVRRKDPRGQLLQLVIFRVGRSLRRR